MVSLEHLIEDLTDDGPDGVAAAKPRGALV